MKKLVDIVEDFGKGVNYEQLHSSNQAEETNKDENKDEGDNAEQ